MRVVKGFAYSGVILLIGMAHFYLLDNIDDILSMIIITLVLVTLNIGIWYLLEESFIKEMDSIKRKYINKGAEDILNQMYDDPLIQEYMKQRVPLINVKGEEYGSTSLWGKIRDFKDKKYTPKDIF